MGLDELVKLLRFSEQPIMLHAANEIERLRAQLAVADESARLQASVADEKIDALTRERDDARDAAKTLLRSPHARVCDPTSCWPWLGD